MVDFWNDVNLTFPGKLGIFSLDVINIPPLQYPAKAAFRTMPLLSVVMGRTVLAQRC